MQEYIGIGMIHSEMRLILHFIDVKPRRMELNPISMEFEKSAWNVAIVIGCDMGLHSLAP